MVESEELNVADDQEPLGNEELRHEQWTVDEIVNLDSFEFLPSDSLEKLHCPNKKFRSNVFKTTDIDHDRIESEEIDVLKRLRFMVIRELTNLFNEGNLNRLIDFLDSRVDNECALITPSISSAVIGKRYVLLFWTTLLRGIPDGVISASKITYNNLTHRVKSTFSFVGTKIHHRFSDILFGRKLAEGARITDAESPSKWTRWTPDEVKSYLSGDSPASTLDNPPSIPGYFSSNVEHVVVDASLIITFNEINKIILFDYDWEFRSIDRVGWDLCDQREGLSDY